MFGFGLSFFDVLAEEPAPVVSLELLVLLVVESGEGLSLASLSAESDLSDFEVSVFVRPVGESDSLVSDLVLLTFTSDETLVTPWVSSARAMARPTMSALSALPFSMTSPLEASTSIEDFETWLSAWSLPLTIVLMTSSSEAPVGAPTTLSLVRTIVTPRSRAPWISVEPRRHSVMREVTSVDVEEAARSLEDRVVAPLVVLVEAAVSDLALCCAVVSLATVELGCVVVSVLAVAPVLPVAEIAPVAPVCVELVVSLATEALLLVVLLSAVLSASLSEVDGVDATELLEDDGWLALSAEDVLVLPVAP